MTQNKRIAELRKYLTALPDNLTVGGSLYLRGTGITALPDNLTVGGSLYLRGTGITALPDNLTVGGYLDLRGTGITALPDNLTVGGSLDLRGTGITALPDNLTVGGYLDLRGTGITALPDNLTVGGSLDLGGTGITALPDNLTVGGSLYLGGTGITSIPKQYDMHIGLLSWQNNKYIKIDDRFSEVIWNRGKVWQLKDVKKDNKYYLVTDGNGKYAHGETVAKAKKDLIYKISNRDKSVFKNIDISVKYNVSECVEMYRVITGACGAGVKNFVESKSIDTDTKFSVSELIEITKGAYGHQEFKNFFA